jgi:hypothetical protein
MLAPCLSQEQVKAPKQEPWRKSRQTNAPASALTKQMRMGIQPGFHRKLLANRLAGPGKFQDITSRHPGTFCITLELCSEPGAPPGSFAQIDSRALENSRRSRRATLELSAPPWNFTANKPRGSPGSFAQIDPRSLKSSRTSRRVTLELSASPWNFTVNLGVPPEVSRKSIRAPWKVPRRDLASPWKLLHHPGALQ